MAELLTSLMFSIQPLSRQNSGFTNVRFLPCVLLKSDVNGYHGNKFLEGSQKAFQKNF